VDRQLPGAAPDADGIRQFGATHAWKARWLIAATALVAAFLTVALFSPKTTPIWRGKATLTVGLAPSTDYLLQGSGPPLTPIENPRDLVVRMSDPVFRSDVVNEAKFEPITAAFSRAMVSSSLRGIALDNGRDVAVELSAGSAADVRAAFAALADEIGELHADSMTRSLRPLHARINDAKDRIALVEKSFDDLNRQLREAAATKKSPRSPPFVPALPASMSIWNEMHDRIRTDTSMAELTEPTVVHPEPDGYPVASYSLEPLRTSILAGIIMLAAMTILTIVVNSPVRGPAE
jgi:hypothetical protein